MNKKKAFTIIELVIVLAVASILLAIIVGLSIFTRGIIISQRHATISLTEYQNAKIQIEDFVNKYSCDYYEIVLLNENSFEMYEVDNENSDLVSKIEFNTETKGLIIYSLDENSELVIDKTTKFKEITQISFNINEQASLLKCSIDFENFNSYEFLINLGGIEIGN